MILFLTGMHGDKVENFPFEKLAIQDGLSPRPRGTLYEIAL